MRKVTAHFDGKVLVPDAPLDLGVGEAVDLSITRRTTAPRRSALRILRRLPLIHIPPEDAEAINWSRLGAGL
jgi:hypothetical protein